MEIGKVKVESRKWKCVYKLLCALFTFYFLLSTFYFQGQRRPPSLRP